MHRKRKFVWNDKGQSEDKGLDKKSGNNLVFKNLRRTDEKTVKCYDNDLLVTSVFVLIYVVQEQRENYVCFLSHRTKHLVILHTQTEGNEDD